MSSNRIHLALGVVFFLVFLGTGLYMKSQFPLIYQGNESIRFQFRVNHRYILLSTLLNVMAYLMMPVLSGNFRKK